MGFRVRMNPYRDASATTLDDSRFLLLLGVRACCAQVSFHSMLLLLLLLIPVCKETNTEIGVNAKHKKLFPM